MKNRVKILLIASLLFAGGAIMARSETVNDVGKHEQTIENPAQFTTSFVAEVKAFDYVSPLVAETKVTVVADDQIGGELPSLVRTSKPLGMDERVSSTETITYREPSNEKKPPSHDRRE